jgi:hypothetical protein
MRRALVHCSNVTVQTSTPEGQGNQQASSAHARIDQRVGNVRNSRLVGLEHRAMNTIERTTAKSCAWMASMV